MFMLLSRIVFTEFMKINTQRQEYIILKESIEPPYYRSNNCSESNVMQLSQTLPEDSWYQKWTAFEWHTF